MKKHTEIRIMIFMATWFFTGSFIYAIIAYFFALAVLTIERRAINNAISEANR